MKHPVGLLVVTVLFHGCGNGRAPVHPTPASVTPTQEYTLSGWVGDSANRPLDASTVEVINGPRAGTVVTTDETGRYAMPGTFTGTITVTATKQGHTPETRTVPPLGPPLPPPSGDVGRWEIYFHLEPLAPPANLAGVYTLTLTADSGCTELPDDARTRTYTATIVPGGRSSVFFARLSDARFFSTSPCPPGRPPETCTYNQFGIGVAGDYVSITGGIVEQLSETAYLVVSGGGGASFDPSGITLPFEGSFQYCSSEPYQIDQGTWACTVNAGVECNSNKHQLALIRR